MSMQPAWQLDLNFGPNLAVVVEPSHGELTSDAGLLLIRQFDQQVGFTQAVAGVLSDPRDPQRRFHELDEMLRTRIYGIMAGYEDQNDHDTLRHDPVFQLICDRMPMTRRDGEWERGNPLASQPTLSRFEPPRAVDKTRSRSRTSSGCAT